MAEANYYTVQIVATSASVTLRAPFHGDLPKRARQIGGDFDKDARLWVFPVEREEQVRGMCRQLFTTDNGPVPKDLDRRSTHERKVGDAGRKAKGRKGSKAKGLAAYSTDDLLAELRRRGIVPAPGAKPVESPPVDPPVATRTANNAGDGADPFSLE